MKEVQRKVAESRLKLLSQHSEVVKWCQKKLKRHSLNQSYKGNENENDNDETSSASNAASTTSSVESVATPALSSSSINQEPDQLDDLSFSLNNQSLVESKIMKQYQFNTEKLKKTKQKIVNWRKKKEENFFLNESIVQVNVWCVCVYAGLN
ncbi:hypothetical protein BpHYR1_018259 [Brachionus plicatilis]|uniref:Uncharacterized protein n=1 Tax=Brachionus plicatilis TaxID=10195 RepID=A0A3M7RW13_BRAPC|nr:hypothetical protein BpHYR1_018259 [Brachionus plicatilis]